MARRNSQSLLALLLLHLLVSGTESVGSFDSAACAAADSLVRLSDFFSRASAGVNVDGYFALSVASLALHSAPAGTLAAAVGECGGAGGGGAALARIDRVLADFRSSQARTGGYDGSVYRGLCRPLEGILRRRLEPGAFRWRRLTNAAGGGDSARRWLQSPRAWFEALNHYDEETGDVCLTEIMAAKRNGCLVTPSCRRFFLSSQPTVGYMLTHQLIYWVAIVENSCHVKLSNGRPVDASLLRHACSRIYREHRDILGASLGDPSSSSKDLPLEQAVLCGGFLGYRDFFADSTTLLMRRLQSERLGCFENVLGPDTAHRDSATTVSTGRRLMRDVTLEGSCSVHTSGLAAAYFALFLRTYT